MVLNYNISQYVSKELENATYFQNFLMFFQLTENNKLELQAYCQLERFHKQLKIQGYNISKNQINKHLLAGPTKARTDASQYLFAYKKANKYLHSKNEINIDDLLHCQKILLNSTEINADSRLYRKNNTIERDGKEYLACNTSDIPIYLNTVCDFINSNEENHVLITAWKIYYLIDILSPFENGNFVFSILLFNNFLERNNMHFGKLLFIEKFLLEEWSTHRASFSTSLFAVDFQTLLHQDIDNFIEQSIKLTIKNINWIKELLANRYLSEIEYDELKPIQKNSINYFIDKGFQQCYDIITQLSERQQTIIKQIALNQSITTKELVHLHRCDRKTIQRDFTELIKLNIVNAIGKTKTLRYKLNFAMNHKKRPTIHS